MFDHRLCYLYLYLLLWHCCSTGGMNFWCGTPQSLEVWRGSSSPLNSSGCQILVLKTGELAPTNDSQHCPVKANSSSYLLQKQAVTAVCIYTSEHSRNSTLFRLSRVLLFYWKLFWNIISSRTTWQTVIHVTWCSTANQQSSVCEYDTRLAF